MLGSFAAVFCARVITTNVSGGTENDFEGGYQKTCPSMNLDLDELFIEGSRNGRVSGSCIARVYIIVFIQE